MGVILFLLNVESPRDVSSAASYRKADVRSGSLVECFRYSLLVIRTRISRIVVICCLNNLNFVVITKRLKYVQVTVT